MEISGDIELPPGPIHEPLLITASDVTVDGRGAVIEGQHSGVGIAARGVSGVRLRNLRVRGFETGLWIEDGQRWTIEDCDFSDNFHDPDFGWGDNGLRGGMVLMRLVDSAIRHCRANRVWDACHMIECDGNELVENDFSHASNTC